MLAKYNNIIGNITSPMLTGSMVGVTAAEMMAMTTMASLHCCDSTFGWTRPMEVRIKIINGNSKNSPIQTIDSEVFTETSALAIETSLNKMPQFVPAATQFTNVADGELINTGTTSITCLIKSCSLRPSVIWLLI